LQEANAALENGEDPEIVRRRLVEVENVNSRRNARIQLCLARCYLLQAKSQNDIDRINKLKNCENWINKSLSNFESFEGLVIK
uniref:Tetratricopeptide repeat protein n=1 Tax=Meloidogyne hapla TaxID=6305 RepID=A0A1I8AXI7_MELHA